MGLRDQLMADLKEAMRSGDEVRKSTIRMLRAAIVNAEKETGATELTEADIQRVIAQQAKQRRDSIAEYKKAGRDDLAAREQAELDIVMEYLPRQLTEEEIEAAARAKIEEVGASSMAQIGDVMRPLMAELGDRADGRLVNQIVRRLLSQ
ncbi:MAG: GatB/YqeY domain-containing protein [Chloroflexi bacterium]|nr:MAG: GatB/YqeY domain-containing protein [Chloroflexota bacterium]